MEIDYCFQNAYEILISEGLVQKSQSATGQGFLFCRRIFKSGNKDDGQLDLQLPQRRLYLEARKPRHLLVQDDAVGRNARF